MSVPRSLAPELTRAASLFPVVTLTGPRQAGKSTLCRAAFPRLPVVNLEAPDIRRDVQDDPRAFLARHQNGAILDEFQRAPELPSYLQVAVDADPRRGRWILTGSHHLTLLSTISQSLAGRTGLLTLLPLHRGELRAFADHPRTLNAALVAGGYPRIFDAGIPPADWFRSYVGTYLERDVRSIAHVGDLVSFQRFIELCAGRTAQVLNLSALASDAGIAQPTARAWLSILEASFLVMRLPPWFRNVGKRLVKSPKLHFLDTGLACWLIGIRSAAHLEAHPLRGALFESWVVSEILKHRLARGEDRGLAYYREQGALEADLILEDGDGITVIEAKAGATLAPDSLAAARRVASRLREGAGDGERAKPVRVVGVHGGEGSRKRDGEEIIAWDELDLRRW